MLTSTLERTRPGPRASGIARLLLVDDHAIVRQGLRSLLDREPGIHVVAEAGSVEEALDAVHRHRPDVVLLDLKLSAGSDSDGLLLCAQLTREFPQIAVLVLTTFIGDEYVLQAVRAGARGYVVKAVDTSALVRAIDDVACGGSAFDASSAAAMVRGISAPHAEAARALTAREHEVLQLLAQGKSNRDIGSALFVSEATAKFHVGNILRKLGASGRAEAVYAASKLGVI
ncbi:MAG: MadR family response regulator transcription factor [Actinomycetales bacterium]